MDQAMRLGASVTRTCIGSQQTQDIYATNLLSGDRVVPPNKFGVGYAKAPRT